MLIAFSAFFIIFKAIILVLTFNNITKTSALVKKQINILCKKTLAVFQKPVDVLYRKALILIQIADIPIK